MENKKYNPYESGDLEIIIENDDLKIVKVLSKDAAFYFGGDFYSNNWDNNFNEGDTYFIISSNEDTPIVSLHNRENNEKSVIRVHDDIIRFGDVDELRNLFPESLKLLAPLVIFGKTFEFLKRVYKGYDPNWNENGGDDLIGEIKFNEKFPNSSIVTILFEKDEDFLDVFDIGDEDKYEWNLHMSNYGGYDNYYQDERYIEDWDNGDFINYAISDENSNSIYNIVKTFYPSISNDNNEKISQAMSNINIDFVNTIVSEYTTEFEDCVYNTIKDTIRSEFVNPFMKFGIKEINFGYKFQTTVGVLLTWYKQTKSENEDLKTLLTTLIEKLDKNNYNRGGWDELRYNTNCDVDYDKFQSFVANELEKVYEGFDDDERFTNYNEFINIQQKVDKEYGFDNWLPIKTDKNKMFKVDKIDPKTNKIIISIRDNTINRNVSDQLSQKRSVDFEELKRLETQYELFEEIKRIVGILK